MTFTTGSLQIVSATFTNANYPGTSPSDFLIANLFGDSISMAFNPDVDAIGLHLSVGTSGAADPGGEATLQLFDGATLLNTTNVFASGVGAFNTFVGWDGLGNISDLNITISSNDNWIAVDDLKFTPVLAPVPVPAAVWLFGSGLLGLVGIARRGRVA